MVNGEWVMDKVPGWCGLMSEAVARSRALYVGVVDRDLHWLYANQGMMALLQVENEAASGDVIATRCLVTNPDLNEWVRAKKEGLLFEGLVSLSDYGTRNYTLNARIYGFENFFLILGENDTTGLFEENLQMSRLNQEINNLQRQLIKEKKSLENALQELKRAQQMLIQSEKMNAMGQLVAGVSHELNNPLAFLFSNLYTIAQNSKEAAAQYRLERNTIENEGSAKLTKRLAQLASDYDITESLQDIEEASGSCLTGFDRIKKIIDNLRTFSRLDETDLKVTDLMANIQATLSVVESEMKRRHVVITVEGPESLKLECFPGHLNQALLNVVMNALQAVDPKGHVGISVSTGENEVMIAVRDSGCGIPPEILSRVFDPFFTTKPVGSGTGLGLSITYQIIHDMHGGSIAIESAPGKGTVVTLQLPLRQNKRHE